MLTQLANTHAHVGEGRHREECIKALRACVGRLPELERQLAALYFCGGLSQLEIAAGMSVPLRIVSVNIEKSLRRMRRQLAQAGYPDEAALQSPNLIEEAFEWAQEVPPDLHEKIMRRIEQTESHAAQSSPRGGSSIQARQPFDWIPWLGLLGLAGCTADWIARTVKALFHHEA